MQFFVPYAGHPCDVEALYQALRSAIERRTGIVVGCRRVERLYYRHAGHAYSSIVGRPDRRAGETVVAILEDEGHGSYLVCTRTHGIGSEKPILVGEAAVIQIEDFEPASPGAGSTASTTPPRA
jgi:acyl-CoA synthetase (AMP-forming)/AMP-acid ligase II